MIEKGKISAAQMSILIYPTIIATAILLIPGATSSYAHQDMWLSPIWGSLMGYVTYLIAFTLNKYHPNETVIQSAGKILGNVPGKIAGLLLLIVFWQDTGITLRQYGEFVVGNFLPKTPIVVVVGCMMLVCAMAVHGGLEVMARSAEFFVPLIVLLFLLIIVLLLPDLDVKNMLPMFENGLTPSLKGAIAPSSWFSIFFLTSFLLPYTGKKEKNFKWGMIAIIAVTATMIASNFASLLLFGNITSTLTYPFFSAARYIRISEFLQHMESVVMAIWVAAIFVKVSVYFYVVVLGMAQWLRLSDYRPIIFPTALLVVLGSKWSAFNLQELSDYLSTTWIIFSLLVYIMIPAMLMCITIIRGKSDKTVNKRK